MSTPGTSSAHASQAQDARGEQEVLELMAKMLDFSDEDKRKVGLRSRRSTGSLGSQGLAAEEGAADGVQTSNVLELWVSFLAAEESESGGL